MTTIILFIGIYWLVDGIFTIIRIFVRDTDTHWGWLVARGLLGIVAGIVALVLLVAAVGLSWLMLPRTEYLPTGNLNFMVGYFLPPPGYSLCHGGHCHTTDGGIESYEEIEAKLAGGGAVTVDSVPPTAGVGGTGRPRA